MEIDYLTYLQSDAWKEIRKLVLSRAKHKCQICSKTEKLEVHHNSYKNLGNEAEHLEDLLVLCREHHKIFHTVKEENSMVSLAESLVFVFKDIENIVLNRVSPELQSGYPDLDCVTGGLKQAELTVVAGRPGMGKTSLALNIAVSTASMYKIPTAIFSLEMPKEQLTYRILSSQSQVNYTRLSSGKIAANEWEPLSKALEKLGELPIFINDDPYISVDKIRSHCKAIEAEHGSLGLIVVDYLQLMSSNGENRYFELSSITRAFKRLSRELNAPIFLLSQVNRGVESRCNKRPVLSDLRDSGSIEEDADVVIMLYRDVYYYPESPDHKLAELIVTKNRNGAIGTAKLLFYPEVISFKNLGISRTNKAGDMF